MILRLLTVVSAFCFFLVGCQSDGCMNPLAENFDANATSQCGSCCVFESNETYAAVNLEIAHMFNDEVLFNSNTYDIGGRAIQITSARWYISNARFGQKLMALNQGYSFIDLGISNIHAGFVRSGSFNELTFDVGVQNTDNHQVPNAFGTEHPLSPKTPDMFWSVSDGHVFLEIRGMVDTSPIPDGVLDASMLLQFGADSLLTSISLTNPLTIDEGFNGTVNLNVEMNYAKLLENLDMTELLNTNQNTPASLSKIATNLSNAIQYQD